MTTNDISATEKKVAAKKPATRAKKVTSKAAAVAKKTGAAKPIKKDKPEKIKMVRDSFSLPEGDYAKLIEMKKKCIAAGVHVKKSELMCLGLLQLAKLGNASLITSAKRIATVKKNKTSKV